MNAAAQEYLAARVMTASPKSLHLLVVDGALRHMARAEELLDGGDRNAAPAALNDARAFVGELLAGLAPDAVDEITLNVKSLFTFVYRRLVEAEIYGDADKVRDAARVLRIHRDTWTALLMQVSDSSPVAAAASTTPVPASPRRVLAEYDDYESRSWSG